MRLDCIGSRGHKEISHTIYRKQYDDIIARLKTEESQRSSALRMMTVEPVFGTLQQYYGLRWINTKGIDLANKVMIMAVCAVNLKNLVKKRIEINFLKLFDLYSIYKASLQSYLKIRYLKVQNELQILYF